MIKKFNNFDKINEEASPLDKAKFIKDNIDKYPDLVDDIYDRIESVVREKGDTDEHVPLSAMPPVDTKSIADMSKMAKLLPHSEMRVKYLDNKDKWDTIIDQSGDKNLEFNRKVWQKSAERIKFEEEHDLYVVILLNDEIKLSDQVDPNVQDDHKTINMMKIKSRFEYHGGDVMGLWVDKGEDFDKSSVEKIKKDGFQL